MKLLEIIEYKEEYQKDLEKLIEILEELQYQFDNLQIAKPKKELREKYSNYLLEEIKNNKGKIYLAKEDNLVVGAVMGIILSRIEEETWYDFNKKEGEILKLVILPEYRNKGIGKMLINRIERFFKDEQCDVVRVGAFAENKLSVEYYKKMGYTVRNINFIKEINE